MAEILPFDAALRIQKPKSRGSSLCRVISLTQAVVSSPSSSRKQMDDANLELDDRQTVIYDHIKAAVQLLGTGADPDENESEERVKWLLEDCLALLTENLLAKNLPIENLLPETDMPETGMEDSNEFIQPVSVRAQERQ